MARMPGADWLGEHSPQPPRLMARYDIFCIHTIVGFAPAHAAHFSTWAGGRIGQSRDTRFQSAANLNGNPRVIASENEDHGPRFGRIMRALAVRQLDREPKRHGRLARLVRRLGDGVALRVLNGVPPLTEEQIQANAQILAWLHKRHGIPLHLCPDSRPGSRGLAYHRQGIDGNFERFRFRGRVRGGELWSSSFGKVCPGDRRIAQLRRILARAIEIVEGDEEVALSKEDKEWLDRRLDAVVEKAEAAGKAGARAVVDEFRRKQDNGLNVATNIRNGGKTWPLVQKIAEKLGVTVPPDPG